MILIEPRILPFISRQCKFDEHRSCDMTWEGFGFEIVCDCVCHGNKDRMLAQVHGRRTSMVIESSHINHNGGQND
jgi:hypothetical protein